MRQEDVGLGNLCLAIFTSLIIEKRCVRPVAYEPILNPLLPRS
ncbi:MAG: hypothetical protein K0S07_834 [Chlamydiales bacterium]|nr:hypothetical protein [Chlamydiales bacterium]